MKDRQWQSLLKLGNDCFHKQQWDKAETFYSEAYDLLAFSYRNNPLCSNTLMAWIGTCHNLSALYESTEKLTLALRFLTVPHEYLLEITKSGVENEDIKLIAFKGLTLTLSPILLFAKKHPICDGCLEGFTSLKGLIKQNALETSSLKTIQLNTSSLAIH
jgi:hypothetical protein